MPKKPLAVWFSEEDRATLDDLAERLDVSCAQVVRYAVRAYALGLGLRLRNNQTVYTLINPEKINRQKDRRKEQRA